MVRVRFRVMFNGRARVRFRVIPGVILGLLFVLGLG